MSTKSPSSTYLGLCFGVLLLGTMLLLTGCLSNTLYTPQLHVYVVTHDTGVSIFTVPTTNGNDNVAPSATVTGAATGLEDPHRLVFDNNNNTYITNYDNNNVTIYSPGMSGNVAPVATISGSNTGLNGPSGIALDNHNNIYVANRDGNSITVYAAGASGNATPTATISGSNTGFNFPNGLAIGPGRTTV